MKCFKSLMFLTFCWSTTFAQNTFPTPSGNVGIGVSSPTALLHVGDGNVYFNTNDSNNAGLRFLFDKTTNNNGEDVDLTIRTNSGSPIVDWYVRNWGGSYTFNRGSSNGKMKLFEINNYGDALVTGGLHINNSDPNNAGLNIKFDKTTNNNGEDVDLTINTNAGSPIVDWYVRNWGGSYTFNRGSSNGKMKLFEINNYGDAFVTGGLHINNSDPNNAGLNIKFDKTTNNNGADVDLTIRTNSGSPIVDWHVSNWGGSYTFNRGSSNGKTNLFRIETNGNIVVPNGKAIVDGLVNCEEVKVEVLDVPDYVFEAGYELRTLKEIKKYIAQNKHLPEIPSAKEIENNGGVELGDMNMRLLKKIEELTLYQIELMEKLERQNAELQDVKKELQELKN